MKHEGVGDLVNCPLAIPYFSCRKCKAVMEFNSGARCRCHKGHKYGAMQIEVGGIKFPSYAEGLRYSKLKFLQDRFIIYDLTLQPKFPINGPDGEPIFNYVADFRFQIRLNLPITKTSKGLDPIIVEDVKGAQTPVFRLKLKMIQAFYPDLNLVLIGQKKKASFNFRNRKFIRRKNGTKK